MELLRSTVYCVKINVLGNTLTDCHAIKGLLADYLYSSVKLFLVTKYTIYVLSGLASNTKENYD